MTEINIFFVDNKVCYDRATSRRDELWNLITLYPSRRVMHPRKEGIYCISIKNDKLAIKIYYSNRMVPYVEVYDLSLKRRVARIEGYQPKLLEIVLKRLGLSEKEIEEIISETYFMEE